MTMLVGMAAVPHDGFAQSRNSRAAEDKDAKSEGPLTILVSLRKQRLHVYDRNGLVATSPISSGTRRNPTPTGIFSVIQKNRIHFSNLYDDAPMPNMQRITWSGVALHAGALPGYPASHGCIRLPYSFSRKLFGMTSLGTRVIVTDDQIAPQDFHHPQLWSSLPPGLPPGDPLRKAEKATGEFRVAAAVDVAPQPARRTLAMARGEKQADIEARLAEIAPREAGVKEAAANATAAGEALHAARAALNQSRAELGKLTKQHASAVSSRQRAERHLADFVRRVTKEKARIDARTAKRLEAHLADAASDLDTEALLKRAETRALEAGRDSLAMETAAVNEQALENKINDLDRIEEEAAAAVTAQKQTILTREQELKTATENVPLSRTAYTKASKALDEAKSAHRRAIAALANFDKPATILISRRTGKIYIRQGFSEVYQAPAEIKMPKSPIGTFVLNAVRNHPGSETEFDWRLLSFSSDVPTPTRRSNSPSASADQDSDAEAVPPALTAANAIERIQLGDEARDRIAEVLKPGSTLIISDAGISPETNEYTDIIVQPR